MTDIAIKLNADEKLTLQRALAHSVEHLDRVQAKKHSELSTSFGIMFAQEKIARLYVKIFPETVLRDKSTKSRS